MKVIVTGAAGFIGSHIVDALLSNGHTPFVIDNFSSRDSKNLPTSVNVCEFDITDLAKIAEIFDEVRPDWLSHQAAQMSVRISMRDPIFDANNNLMGHLNVFDNTAHVAAKKIVFASSGGVLYGEATPLLWKNSQNSLCHLMA